MNSLSVTCCDLRKTSPRSFSTHFLLSLSSTGDFGRGAKCRCLSSCSEGRKTSWAQTNRSSRLENRCNEEYPKSSMSPTIKDTAIDHGFISALEQCLPNLAARGGAFIELIKTWLFRRALFPAPGAGKSPTLEFGGWGFSSCFVLYSQQYYCDLFNGRW